MGNFCGGCNTFDDKFEIQNFQKEELPTYNFIKRPEPVPIRDTKVKPPFPEISSFIVAVEVLSFYGYLHEAQFLLQSLNHNSRTYMAGHQTLIDNAIRIDRQFIKKPLFLGKNITTPNFDLGTLSLPFEWPNNSLELFQNL